MNFIKEQYQFNVDNKNLNNKITVDKLSLDKYYKTIFEFETDLNDAKAKINLIDFRYVIDFESRLQELLVSN